MLLVSMRSMRMFSQLSRIHLLKSFSNSCLRTSALLAIGLLKILTCIAMLVGFSWFAIAEDVRKEPIGVIGIRAPDEFPLLGLVTTLASACAIREYKTAN